MNSISRIRILRAAILVLVLAAAAAAADGDLDTSFGGDGIVTTDNISINEGVTDVVSLADGKTLALAYSIGGTPASERAVIIRYNTDGSVDTTFGINGKVTVTQVRPGELAVLPSGKIVFVATRSTSSGSSDIYVARLNGSGSFDTTFGTAGSVTIDLRSTEDVATSLAVRGDGRLLIGGGSARPTSGFDNVLVSVNANGTLDTTFGGAGVVYTVLGSAGSRDGHADIAIQPDGKIVTVSAAPIDNPGSEPLPNLITARYTAAGVLDPTFSGDGLAFTVLVSPPPNGITVSTRAASVMVATDGKIISVGSAGRCCAPLPLSYAAFARFHTDGSPDNGFGPGGFTLLTFQNNVELSAGDAKLQSDNKIVFTGAYGNSQNRALAIGRLTTAGVFDTTFGGGDGWSITPFSSGTFDRGDAISLRSDGKIVAAGSRTVDGRSDLLLTRWLGPPTLVRRQAIADFDGDGRSDLSVYRSGTWFINSSLGGNPNNYSTEQFGLDADLIAPADYDGDGKTDIAVWRESSGFYYVLNSNTGTVRIESFGRPGDDPMIAGDWDGDGKADIAVYRDGSLGGGQGAFYYLASSQAGTPLNVVLWGSPGDRPARGDFDGDGKMDAAVFRNSDATWYILQSSNSQVKYELWGLASDHRVAGDFDGDGRTDLAIYRNGVWAIRDSGDREEHYERWGLAGDLPVAGDYDGDGDDDLAVWRNGVYYILPSPTSQPVYRQFGQAGDLPAANAFVR